METAAQFRVEERWQGRGRCAVCSCTAHLGEAGLVCCWVCTSCCGSLAVLSGFALLAVAWGLAALSRPTLPKVWGGVGGRLCALLCTAGGAEGGLGELSDAALPKAEGRLGELSGATPPRPTLTNQHPDW